MKALIAAGGIHQDADGWWVDDATGELIGPDPEIERPLTLTENVSLSPFGEAHPELASKLRRARGKQKAPTKVSTTLRLDRDVLERFKASGPGWQSRMNDALRAAAGIQGVVNK
ncbi:MAG TPA: BrnA antitoxin family protein [Sphingopyxis sp.]|nr:BrnA antitoxin family protein [Sphingopyxis sp.]